MKKFAYDEKCILAPKSIPQKTEESSGQVRNCSGNLILLGALLDIGFHLVDTVVARVSYHVSRRE